MTDIFDLESRSILIDGLAGDIGSCSGRAGPFPRDSARCDQKLEILSVFHGNAALTIIASGPRGS